MDCDVVVVGSGGAGLTAALVAAMAGLKVLVVEKTEYLGGATAISGGGLWIPNTALAKAAGFKDSEAEAALFLKGRVGQDLREDLTHAFLAAGPQMVDFLQQSTEVQFALSPYSPDWGPDLAGAKLDGRLIGPKEYDGRRLGKRLGQLRPPIRTFNAPGGLMIDLTDLPHLANAKTSAKSMLHLAKLMGGFIRDRLRGRRGTRLTMGNALAARLIVSAEKLGVTFWTQANAQALISDARGVTGVEVLKDGRPVAVAASRGVVLASGGFSANADMRAQHIPFPDHHVTIMPEGSTGDGLQMAERVGARYDGRNIANAAWSVVSVDKTPDGRSAWYAHLLDMAKPGCIAVDKRGRRFANEASDMFVEAMHNVAAVPAHLVCDARFIKAYGFGMVFPGGMGLKRLKRSGYLIEAPDLRSLASRIGVDPDGLEATVKTINAEAPSGHDHAFGKGESVVDRSIGDPNHRPNPCLGLIEQAPFYAIQIFPGDGSSTLGLRVDAHARVLDGEDHPITGLYACGLDMNSLWRGRPPAHGANNGLNMTFGYIAGSDLVSRQAL